MKKNVELLAPVGDFECLKAAVQNGADSVYLGGSLFNARATATNFDYGQLEEVINYCSLRNVKTHLTLNTLIKDHEFKEALELAQKAYEFGADAFIVQDIERTTVMLQQLFDAKVIYDSGKNTFSLSQERFFDIDGLWLVIMQGESLKETTYNHIAFKIDEKEYDEYKKRIETLGLTFREGRSRIEGEGRSLYFYDYDNHLFELHTGTLSERLKSYDEYNKQHGRV